MKRRTFLLGAGSTAFGGGALLGSGAFTRVESQRRVTVAVAHDWASYLPLKGCWDSPNWSYTRFDGEGRVEIVLSPDNETEAGGSGVNSDSRSYFDSVFQVCNHGKEPVSLWLGDDPAWPTHGDERRVEFYHGSSAGADDLTDLESIVGRDDAVPLGVGECRCFGMATVTKGLSEGDKLLEALDHEITVHADTRADPEPGLPGTQIPPEESQSQFRALRDLGFDEVMRVSVLDEGRQGTAEVGVRVTDHHGTFRDPPTTYNPGAEFLATTRVEFEDGLGEFTVGNPGVDGVTFSLFPIDGGLETVNDIENVAVEVEGAVPDRLAVSSAGAPATATVESDQPFTEGEHEE